MYRIGIDVGGTFTDFAITDERNGETFFHKVPSTPHDPSEAIATGIEALLHMRDIQASDISHIGHGTTVATNLIIERKGSPTGLITTAGFRDVLEIARQTRPHLYDYSVGKVPPLITREHRIEVAERMDAQGQVLVPLDEAGVYAAARQLRDAGLEAVTICFLHAYRNPVHEQRAQAIVQEVFPAAYISISSDVLPEFREYERLSTTALNAAVGPKMSLYLERFLSKVRDLGVVRAPSTIHSNGGLMSIETVRQFPVRTCLSGPAAGVVGAAAVGRAIGYPNLVTFDVGGTSTDVSLIHDGKPLFTSTRAVAGYPVKTPMVDIHVIGAGGGSIAAIDDAGSLKVGPRSAGAVPGPVAYMRGGVEPTITDAEIALQRLNPVALLDGRMPVDAEGARHVIRQRVAEPLSLSIEDAAEGIIRIANANMARAIRSVSTERGYDLAQFALYAFGGAGPLHALEVAEESGIGTVIVPQEPGTMCARGILLTDISFDFVRSRISLIHEGNWSTVVEAFIGLHQQADAWLDQEGVSASQRSVVLAIDARYVGQNFEVQVAMDRVGETDFATFAARFREAHIREYGYDVPDRAIEVINCRLKAVGEVSKAPLIPVGNGAGDAAVAQKGARDIYHGKRHGWHATPVYARSLLMSGATLQGPAVIEEMSSTTVLSPAHSLRVDAYGNLIVQVAALTTVVATEDDAHADANAYADESADVLADPIEMEVFANRLLSISEDMNNTLVRSSFSTNIKERKDCSVALFDHRARLVVQGTQIPLHLGSLNGAVNAVLAHYPADTIQPGDVFICNDPYLSNGSHLPDINVVTPVFFESKLVFFAANVGHHADVGGTVPGSIAGGSRSIFEEGIRIPIVRIVRAGSLDEEMLRLLCNNTRDPEERSLDLRVQIATNARGAQAVAGLIAQMGIVAVQRSVNDVIGYTRKRLRNRISELKQGRYTFESFLDDDGLGGGEPVAIVVSMTVGDGTLHFDFTGSGKQARGAMNLPLNALYACVYYAVKALLDPELPANAGLFDPISLFAPVGTITNPAAPAAVGARSITAQKVAGAIFGAFRGVLPDERIMASSNDCCPAIVFSGPLRSRPGSFVYLETMGGGSGARYDSDGMDGVHVHMTNTSNLPVEALENEYPLRVEEYALIPDTGGAGRTRGGLAIAKQISAIGEGIVFSARSDSHVVGVAAGVSGGHDGHRAKLIRQCNDTLTELSSKTANITLPDGESVRLETSGGGGYGAPEARSRAALERDVRDGKISPRSAMDTYGMPSPSAADGVLAQANTAAGFGAERKTP